MTTAGFLREHIDVAYELGKFNDHTIQTPWSLVDEIVDQFPIMDSALVLYNPEFVWAMHERGWPLSNITIYADCPSKKKWADKIGINYIQEGIEYGDDMKFDVVVGNPPYQNGKDKSFYKKFIRFADDMTIHGGYIAFICPIAWMKPKDKLFRMFNDAYTFDVINADAAEYFKIGMGSRVQYFIAKKCVTADKECVKLIWDGVEHLLILPIEDLTKFNSDTKAKAILDKVYAKGTLVPFKGKGQNEFVAESTENYSYDVYLSSKEDRRCVFAKDKPEHYGVKKVIASHIMEPYRFDSFGEISTKGVGRYAQYYLGEDDQLHAIREFFNTDLYAFIDKHMRHGRYAQLELPVFGTLTQPEELYAHFELTNEEIAYIESSSL